MDKFKTEVIKMARGYDRNRNDNSNEVNEVIKKINDCNQLKEIGVPALVDKDTGLAYKVAEISINSRSKVKLNTNQLRKFFGAIRKMESKTTWAEIEPEFYLLKPRMAASVGRDNLPKDFYNVIMATMNKVNVGSEEDKLENFKIFVEFFEAIVAYHKFLGGN